MDPVAGKMSKSKPDSAIFVHESEETIRKKIRKAYCPEGVVEGNPIFDILEWLILRDDTSTFTIRRPEKFGGDVEGTLSELKDLYMEKKIHPLDLKAAVADWLVGVLAPVRSYFEKHPEYVEELLEAKITR